MDEQGPRAVQGSGLPQQVTFPAGLIGCEEWQHFVLLEAVEAGPVKLLQCLDDPDVGLYVADAYLIKDDYQLEVPEEVLRSLGVQDWRDCLVLCTLTVRENPLLVTANLLGPLIINRVTGLGAQVVLSGSGYDTRYVVVSEEGGER